MPFPLIAAGVAAVGSIGGALISSSSQKKAANTAAAVQQQATDSQLQLGRENINFQQGIYDQNKALLSPFVSRGNDAGSAINAMLGLGGAANAPQAAQQPAQAYAPQPGVQQNQIVSQTPLGQSDQPVPNRFRFLQETRGGDQIGADYGYENPINPAAQPQVAAQPQAAQTQPAAQTAQPGQPGMSQQDSAFNNFANSAGMQFQLQQGTNALNNMYAGRGSLLSGAAMKGIQNYGQHTALNNYFLPYMGLLQGQQATGAQSGAAIAGVGSNFGNTVSSIYGGQANAIQSGADAASNAALLKGQANAGLYNTLGSSLGNLASSFIQPSYGGGGYSPYGRNY
jgi:hypothetical protein